MMLSITERLPSSAVQTPCDDSVILPFDLRQKSRLRVRLQSGLEAALQLARGSILRGGDRLLSGDGRIVQVVAADEPVLHVTAVSSQQLMRAVYHLANRHVPLQIGGGADGECWLRLEQDHVLKDMLLGLGMSVIEQQAPFEPEAGAYGGGHHHHEH
ncbi:MAG TPA: urease accessory protein UreE [Spongiibacteraceae bacterium]|nr:urease accessory protein UreE [Spongiibacteraceae bacterium]